MNSYIDPSLEEKCKRSPKKGSDNVKQTRENIKLADFLGVFGIMQKPETYA